MKGIIQKRNQEISYLIHEATRVYSNVKDIVGDEVWHFTVDSEEVQELLQVACVVCERVSLQQLSRCA